MHNTKIPWKIEGEDPRQIGKIIRDSDGNDICELAHRKNAHLISAAPEMLEALEQVINHANALMKNHETVNLILNAIKKAKGE